MEDHYYRFNPSFPMGVNVLGGIDIITYYMSKRGIWLVISRVASYFHEPEVSANTAYE